MYTFTYFLYTTPNLLCTPPHHFNSFTSTATATNDDGLGFALQQHYCSLTLKNPLPIENPRHLPLMAS